MIPNLKPDAEVMGIEERCCTATTGCEWDGTLRHVVTEPIFVQKVYDATLVHLQALATVNNAIFTPRLHHIIYRTTGIEQSLVFVKLHGFLNDLFYKKHI